MLPTLLYLPHSPWSLKALCAVRHHRVEVRKVPYRPFLDDPAARLRLARSKQRWTGRVSVPMLFTESEVARNSWEVARYADVHGTGPTLFASRDLVRIAEWNERSDRILEAGRALFMLRVLHSVPAMRELSPPPLASMPPAILRASIRMFNAKYGIRESDVQQHERQILLELDAIRAALAGGERYLCGSFSYADIAIGIALQGLQPVPGSGFGPASEQLAGNAVLSATYADLTAWRNAIHARHPLV
jgi:glutathione S-transferase